MYKGKSSNDPNVEGRSTTKMKAAESQAINQTNGFYDSVSISFLSGSISQKVLVEVMQEPLRILRPDGILNVLDMDGSAMKIIQGDPKFRLLKFGKATGKDQDRHETNIKTILENSGLETRFKAKDPHILHWTAIVEQSNPPTNQKQQVSTKAATHEQLTFKRVSHALSQAKQADTVPAAA